MLAFFRSRACRAVIAVFLIFSLSACASGGGPAPAPAETPAPSAEPLPEDVRRWSGSFDPGEELAAALGFDLSPWLAAPLQASLQLALDEDGRCTLDGDYAACAPALRAALSACVRELQEQEAGASLNGLALAESLGGDPNDIAAALCDELLPQPFRMSGRFSADRTWIDWDAGGSSEVRTEDGVLCFTLPGRGEVSLRPAEIQ